MYDHASAGHALQFSLKTCYINHEKYINFQLYSQYFGQILENIFCLDY